MHKSKNKCIKHHKEGHGLQFDIHVTHATLQKKKTEFCHIARGKVTPGHTDMFVDF